MIRMDYSLPVKETFELGITKCNQTSGFASKEFSKICTFGTNSVH
jgi:hypothetical protein